MADADTAELERNIQRCWDIAIDLGLDPFPVDFHLVPASIMYEFGAYGLPGRYAHWTHGRAYHSMKQQYDYGLAKIYEMVVNTNPSQAFLLENNSLLQNTMVVAHVFGHSFCFKHNIYFQSTNRNMLRTVEVNAERFAHYEFEYGIDALEQFLDAALSIEEHSGGHPHDLARASIELPKEIVGPYDDLFDVKPSIPRRKQKPLPERSADLLGFIAEHAPDLEDWERDILWVVREEAQYFRPQRFTKILNEGIAVFAHSHIMQELELKDQDYTDYAKLHAGVLAAGPLQLNPYKLGFAIMCDIDKRLGRQAVLDACSMESDASLIRNYLTEELVKDQDLYLFATEDKAVKVVDRDWEHVRDALAEQIADPGYPHIEAVSADHHGRRELLLEHAPDEQELDIPRAEKTLRAMYKLWRRPVHLLVRVDGRKRYLIASENGVENISAD